MGNWSNVLSTLNERSCTGPVEVRLTTVIHQFHAFLVRKHVVGVQNISVDPLYARSWLMSTEHLRMQTGKYRKRNAPVPIKMHSYRALSGLHSPVVSVSSFEYAQNFPPDRADFVWQWMHWPKEKRTKLKRTETNRLTNFYPLDVRYGYPVRCGSCFRIGKRLTDKGHLRSFFVNVNSLRTHFLYMKNMYTNI